MLPALIWSLISAILWAIFEILVIVAYVAIIKIDRHKLTPDEQTELDYLSVAFIPITIVATVASGKLQTTNETISN